MPYLDSLEELQRRLVVSLPYRVGLWISASDAGGGGQADDAEKNALESIVRGYAEDFCKSELVEEVIKKTVAARDQWPSWEQDLLNVLVECREAIELLAVRADRKNVASFKHTLLEIGTAVALAHREMSDEPGLADRLDLWVRFGLSKFESFFKKRQALSFEDIQNISKAEHAALNELVRVIRPQVLEGLPVVDVRSKEESGAEAA